MYSKRRVHSFIGHTRANYVIRMTWCTIWDSISHPSIRSFKSILLSIYTKRCTKCWFRIRCHGISSTICVHKPRWHTCSSRKSQSRSPRSLNPYSVSFIIRCTLKFPLMTWISLMLIWRIWAWRTKSRKLHGTCNSRVAAYIKLRRLSQ